MNEHFSTVGKTMASKFENTTLPNTTKDPLDYITKKVDETISFSEVSSSEILKIILEQDTKKACGYDEINNKIIKKTSITIAPFLEVLFNACMKEGIYPDCFKIAQVIPLFKGGDKTI